VLQYPRHFAAAIGEQHRIVELAVHLDHGADQHRRPGRCGGRNQPRGFLSGGTDQCGLQHQILGRIADQLQLGAQQQIGARGFIAHRQHRRAVGGEVAHALVHLGKRDGQAVGHLGARFSVRAPRGKLGLHVAPNAG
jgi:hypothetical protein